MKITAIALNTFRESVRDRVLYNLVLFVALIVLAATVVGRIAVGQEAKIIIDVGLSATSIFGLLIAIFIGIGLVSKEIEKRTLAVSAMSDAARCVFTLTIWGLGLLAWWGLDDALTRMHSNGSHDCQTGRRMHVSR